MTRELEAATLQAPFPTFPIPANTPNLQFIANLPSNTVNATVIPGNCLNPHGLFWQAPVASHTSRGNMAEIGYFVRWDTSQPGSARATLCRFQVDPADASGNKNANYNLYDLNSTTGQPANWLVPIPTVAPAVAPSYQGWFADNVIALWVRCLDSQNQPITENAAGTQLNFGYGFDSRQGYTDSQGLIHPAPALPYAVEIAIVAVDSRTALKIQTPLVAVTTTPGDFDKGSGTSGSVAYFMNNLPATIKPGAELFTTQIILRNYSQ
jgi:hypothetical protein